MEQDAVVLLHGLGVGSWMMGPLGRGLTRAGYLALNLGYRSRAWPLERIVDDLHARLAASPAAAAPQVHFVTHSMGGLIARAWLARRRPAALGRVVMLGPPNGGSEWVSHLVRARLAGAVLRHAHHVLAIERPATVAAALAAVDYPVGVIAGDRSIWPLLRHALPQPNDGMVTVAATHVAGEADHIVLPVAHTLMPVSAAVRRQVIAFLQRGCFEHGADASEPSPFVSSGVRA